MVIPRVITWVLMVTCQSVFVSTCSHDLVVDVVFSVEASSTTRPGNFHFFLDFITAVVENLDINEAFVKVGVVSTDTRPATNFNLSGNRDAILKRLENMVLADKQTLHTQALGYSKVLLPTSGQRIVILLVDGTDPAKSKGAINMAKILKDAGITIFTVAFGSKINPDECTAIASKPEFFFQVSKYEDFGDAVQPVLRAICDATA